ncbi:MAG TPA: hypothetical protein VGG48_03590 [Rhizomicrobium sp.]|jgi:hypothetical protein
MQLSIVQTLAMAGAANGVLNGRAIGPFWPNSSVFQFTKQCDFKKKDGTLAAPDPMRWIEGLAGHCKGVWLHGIQRNPEPGKDRELVNFVGGGPRWILEDVRDGSSSLWESRDTVLDRNDPQRKIWGTTFVEIADDWRRPRPQSRGVAAVAEDLRATLTDIASLAQDGGLTEFEAQFRQALVKLDEAYPLRGTYHADIADIADYTRETRKLFGAVQSAWVFGGMGSWNDIKVAGQEARYDGLSEKLFQILVEATVAIGNSTFQVPTLG